MCGIAGFINKTGEPASRAIMQDMTDVIAHRGPDGEGHWVQENIAIGHRRLAIIDTSMAANQPMVDPTGSYVLSYNGEVYNFRELRAELVRYGFQFRSKSDSEVVLYSLIHWGEKALDKFNGMFALAFWCCADQTLLVARDRYGIKPLYYYSDQELFAFGSEQKAILRIPRVKPEINKQALIEYFTFQNFFTEQTLHSGILMLKAGHYLKYRVQDCELPSSICYWDFEFSETGPAVDAAEYEEELERLMIQAVKRQLVSDVELGTYLSGGMDSGSIAAIASQVIPGLKSFTCGFDLSSASGIEIAFDERAQAEAISAFLKTEQYEMVLKAGDMERIFSKLVWHLEEPRVGQSYPNFYASQLASKFVKVVLSGVGGDEIFAGYPWRYYGAMNSSSFEQYIDNYYLQWNRLVPNRTIKNLFSPIKEDLDKVWTRDIFKSVFQHHKNQLHNPVDYINHSLYFEAKTFLHGILTVEDKLSMAHGLETRIPFLDNDLVDFASGCPVELKLKNLTDLTRINENEPGNKTEKYFKKTNDGKIILRKVMSSFLPVETVGAVKQGFSGPDASWFKGESIDFVKKNLLTGNARILEYLDEDVMRMLINDHLDGNENRRLLIWSLLSVEKFLQTDWKSTSLS